MSNCSNCYNGCTEIVSDRCVKYTGINIPALGIQNGDTLSAVEESITTYIWIPSAILMLTLGLFIENIVVVIIVFILFYLIFNIRKPLMIELIGDVCEKDKRSSVLSIESQLTSLFIIVMAPLFGYLSDTYSIAMMFILFSSAILVFEVGKLLTRKNV